MVPIDVIFNTIFFLTFDVILFLLYYTYLIVILFFNIILFNIE
jgi:hypothetical protein